MFKTARSLMLFALCWFVVGCGASATATPAPTVTSIPPTKPLPALARTFFIAVANSIINYEATLQLGGVRIGGTFKTLGNWINAIPEGATGQYRFEIDVVFDGTSVSGANDLVVNALKTNLEVDKFPIGRFRARTVGTMALDAGATLSTTAEGTLEVHGVERPLTLPVQVRFIGGKLEATGSTTIDLLDFKVNVPTAILKSQIGITAILVADEKQ